MTLNNLFLAVLTATVFLGTFSPVFIEMLNGDKISVGPPYYALTFRAVGRCRCWWLAVFGPAADLEVGTSVRARPLVTAAKVPAAVAGVVLLVGAAVAGGLKGVVTAIERWRSGGLVDPGVGWRFSAGAGGQDAPISVAQSERRRARMVGLTDGASAGLGLLALGITGVTTSWDSGQGAEHATRASRSEFAGRTLTMQATTRPSRAPTMRRGGRDSTVVQGGSRDLQPSAARRRWLSHGAERRRRRPAIRVTVCSATYYVSVGEESEAGHRSADVESPADRLDLGRRLCDERSGGADFAQRPAPSGWCGGEAASSRLVQPHPAAAE